MLKKLGIFFTIYYILSNIIFSNLACAKEAFTPATPTQALQPAKLVVPPKEDNTKDPFVPYMLDSSGGDLSNGNNSSSIANSKFLTDRPLGAYNLIGIIASKNKSVAVLKSRDKREYFAKTGDKIGNQGGKITDINKDGIVVTQGSETINIGVSNQFEIRSNDK